MKRRIIPAVLAVLLCLSTLSHALASEAASSLKEASEVLAALNIMVGDARGDLHLERNVTRAEFTKLAIAASPYADSVGSSASFSPYPDVPRTSWAAPYIQAAREKGLINGYLDGTFRPEENVRLVEGVSIVLALLGYTKTDFSGAWGSGQMALYRSLGLDRGISASRDDAMTRQDALWLFYHLLTARTKSAQIYLTTLGHALTPSGEIDRVALINSAMEGPIIAEGVWQSAIPFDISTAAVTRDGAASSREAIQARDVVYWCKPMRALWVWSGKAAGTIQALSPSASSPASVMVGGKSYAIETSSAAYDLSDLGTYRTGDMVTLLLGRSGGVAAVRAPLSGTDVLYGTVTATGSAAYQSAGGGSYAADTVWLTATDGSRLSYPCPRAADRFSPGDLIRVTAGIDGMQFARVSAAALTGRVSVDGAGLADRDFAPDIEILDTYGSTMALRIYPTRLAGINLEENMVRFYSTDALGRIDRLILRDVTGDLHRYGVLTAVSEQALGMTLLSSYQYDVAGVPGAYSSQNISWSLQKGPCQIRMDGTTVDRIYNLSPVPLTALSGLTAQAGTETRLLSDNAAAYEYRDGKYYLSDLVRLSGKGFRLTGYCDKAESAGGRIRIVVGYSV